MAEDKRTIAERKRDAEIRASLNRISRTLREHGLIGRPDSITAEYRRKRAAHIRNRLKDENTP